MNSRILRNKIVRSTGLQTIGNYVINTGVMLGQGSFSRIYKGTDKRTGMEVAVKVIDLNMINSKGLRKFLDHEIKINSMVDHPYVLWCYEISYNSTNCYIVTEYCSQGDLQRYVKDKGKLSQTQALRLFKQLIVGLRYLHGKKILHRDLKSSNVFIKNGDIRIADFGLSHCFESDNQMDRVLIGTPGYMAPETLLNNEYSYKCDVWALGNIFVEMLTGQAPFMNTQSLEQLKTMFKSSIQLKLENISKTSCELVECMLQLDKNERISIEELYNMFCVADGSILKKQNIHGRQINKNSSSLKWNINKKEILDGRADCKLHLLQYLLSCAKQFSKYNLQELVQLIGLFSERIFRDGGQSTETVMHPQLQRVVKGIWRYSNGQIGVHKALDMNNFLYYIADLQEDMRESSYIHNELIQQLRELQQVVLTYQQGWGKLQKIRWTDIENDENQSSLNLCNMQSNDPYRRGWLKA